MTLPTYVRVRDLIERGIVNSRKALEYRIKNLGFPPGRLVGNSRLFTEQEVLEWIESHGSEPKQVTVTERHISRRKVA